MKIEYVVVWKFPLLMVKEFLRSDLQFSLGKHLFLSLIPVCRSLFLSPTAEECVPLPSQELLW